MSWFNVGSRLYTRIVFTPRFCINAASLKQRLEFESGSDPCPNASDPPGWYLCSQSDLQPSSVVNLGYARNADDLKTIACNIVDKVRTLHPDVLYGGDQRNDGEDGGKDQVE